MSSFAFLGLFLLFSAFGFVAGAFGRRFLTISPATFPDARNEPAPHVSQWRMRLDIAEQQHQTLRKALGERDASIAALVEQLAIANMDAQAAWASNQKNAEKPKKPALEQQPVAKAPPQEDVGDLIDLDDAFLPT